MSSDEDRNADYSLVDYQGMIWSLATTQQILASWIQIETDYDSPYGDKWQELQPMSCLESGSGSARETKNMLIKSQCKDISKIL